MKSYGDKVNTNFQGKRIPKENASYKCLSLTMLDSVVRVNKKYYRQTLLEKCKYKIEKNKMENLINDNLESRSSDELDNESDNESDNDSHNESDNKFDYKSENSSKKPSRNLIMINLKVINLLIMNLKIKTILIIIITKA